ALRHPRVVGRAEADAPAAAGVDALGDGGAAVHREGGRVEHAVGDGRVLRLHTREAPANLLRVQLEAGVGDGRAVLLAAAAIPLAVADHAAARQPEPLALLVLDRRVLARHRPPAEGEGLGAAPVAGAEAQPVLRYL